MVFHSIEKVIAEGDFLGLNEDSKYSESDLESAIIDKIEEFLLELGKGFLFESRQKRFTFDEDHFFVDLVFYNRLLGCYVLIDLKIGEITHQDLGQVKEYKLYLPSKEELRRKLLEWSDDNASVGLLKKKTRDNV